VSSSTCTSYNTTTKEVAECTVLSNITTVREYCRTGAGLVCEFTSSGQLVGRIKLPDDVSQPVHAVQVTSSRFVVSHYDGDESNASTGAPMPPSFALSILGID